MKILKRCALALGAILILSLLVSHIHILMFNDITVEPISPADNPDFQATEIKHRPPVFLVSYADGAEIFFKNQNALTLSALNKGIDCILNYRRSHLDPEFVQNNHEVLKQKMGAGLWVWKPYVILKTMEKAPENAIILYLDVGFAFRGSLEGLLKLAKKQDVTLSYYPSKEDLIHTISTKTMQLVSKCTTQQCLNGKHVRGGFLLLRNTPQSRSFIRRWLDLCTNKEILADTLKSHDEALLSMLHHLTPTSAALPVEDFAPYFHLHHRYPKEEFLTLLPRMKKNITGIEQQLLNSTLMIKLRAYFLPKFFTNHFEAKKKKS